VTGRLQRAAQLLRRRHGNDRDARKRAQRADAVERARHARGAQVAPAQRACHEHVGRDDSQHVLGDARAALRDV
jgi:hypothetical protein